MSADAPNLEGNGIYGATALQFLEWLHGFMKHARTPSLKCGVLAHAAIWSWAVNRGAQLALMVDPQNADIIRTPFGPMKMTIDKGIESGSIFVKDGDQGEYLAVATNFQQINP